MGNMNIGMITCTYFMSIYGYKQPEPFDWGEMCKKYRSEFSTDDFLKLSKEIRDIGFNAMEIWEPMFSFLVYDKKQASDMAKKLHELGFEKLVYCIGGWSAADIPNIERAYDFAKAMDCKVVTGCVYLPDAQAVTTEMQRVGEKYNMLYAIENHPEPNIEKPDDVARVCEGKPNVGANLDTGIYNALGYDVIATAKLLKDKVFHCHLKDVAKVGGGCQAIGDADTPCAELLSLFSEWNYPYMVSVEYEYPTNPVPGLYKSMGFINGVLKTIKTLK
jgi:sugar phosphate isomerase/epimerase